MVAANPYRPRHLARSGNRAAVKDLALLDQTQKMPDVIVLGNNLVNAKVATLVNVIAIVIAIALFGEEKRGPAVGTPVVIFGILVFSEITRRQGCLAQSLQKGGSVASSPNLNGI